MQVKAWLLEKLGQPCADLAHLRCSNMAREGGGPDQTSSLFPVCTLIGSDPLAMMRVQ